MVSNRAVAQAVLVTVGVLAGLYLLYQIRQIIGLVFISIFLAAAIGPLVDLIQRRGVRRVPAILASYLALMLAIFGIGLLVVPPIVDEINALAKDVPGYVDDLRQSETIRDYDDKYQITDKLRQEAEKLPNRLGDAAGALQSVTVGIFAALFQAITVLVMTFFFLLDGRRMLDFLFRQLRGDRERRAREIAGNVYRAVSGYVAGAGILALIAGITTYGMMTVLGIPFAIPLSVLMAFLVLIPLVGATVGGIIIAGVAATHDFPTPVIIWTIFFILYQQLENNVMQPFVYRRTVALHPLLVIIAVLVGASQLGVLGALLAIPVAASIQVVVRDFWEERQRKLKPGPPPSDGPSAEPSPEPA
jgi:predicted PurR-regulated permease PerM